MTEGAKWFVITLSELVLRCTNVLGSNSIDLILVDKLTIDLTWAYKLTIDLTMVYKLTIDLILVDKLTIDLTWV